MSKIIISLIFIGLLLFLIPTNAKAAPSVSCNAPVVTAPIGGGTVNINVTCTMSNISAGVNTLTPSATNIVSPSSITLNNGVNTLTATLQSTVTSPDSTITGISGAPLIGFIGVLSVPTSTIQFQYQATTTALTPVGSYVSSAGAMSYNWRILNVPAGITSGTANATLQVNVPAPPTTISCVSPSISSPAGGGSFTMNVNCSILSSGSSFSPSGSNVFSPSSLLLTNGSNTLNATLQSSVSSPDGTVSGITGSASGGFTGTINTLPATIQARYAGTTTATTPSGTYTSGTITYIWSVI